MWSGEAAVSSAHLSKLHPQAWPPQMHSPQWGNPRGRLGCPHFTDGMRGPAPTLLSKNPTPLGGPRGFSTVSTFSYQKTEPPFPHHLWKQVGESPLLSVSVQMEKSSTSLNPGS